MKNSIGSRTRAAKTVLEVLTVTGSSGKHIGDFDSEANGVLQAAGFVQLKKVHNGICGRSPGGDTLILVVYDVIESRTKHFQLISVRGTVRTVIDQGYSIYIQETSGKTAIEFDGKGNQLTEWTISCVPAERASIEQYEAATNTASTAVEVRGSQASVESVPDNVEKVEGKPEPVTKPVSPRSVQRQVTLTVPRDALALPKREAKPFTPLVLPAKAPANGASNGNGNGHAPAEDPHERPPFEGAIKVRLDEIVAFQPSKSEPSFSGQPRKSFDPVDLRELADSITEEGQQQAVIVMPYDGPLPGIKYELIGGERRWRACRIAGKQFVWAVIRKTKDKKDQHLSALIENLHRKGNTDLETARALQEQIDAGTSIVRLAKVLGKGRQHVYNYLILLQLHPDLQALMDPPTPKRQRIKKTVAQNIAKAPIDRQLAIWEEAKKQPTRGLVFRKITELVKEFASPHAVRAKKHCGEDPSNVARLFEGKFTRLTGVLVELQAFTAEEYQKFAAFKGTEQVKTFARCLTEAERSVSGIKQRLIKAQYAARTPA